MTLSQEQHVHMLLPHFYMLVLMVCFIVLMGNLNLWPLRNNHFNSLNGVSLLQRPLLCGRWYLQAVYMSAGKTEAPKMI